MTLTVQQRWHFFAEIFNNRIWASLNLQTGGNGVQFDIGFDLSGRRVNLLGLFVGPHRGAKLCLAKWPLESWSVDAHRSYLGSGNSPERPATIP